MGDGFSFMPVGTGVLKKFALLLQFFFIISCTAVHPKKKNIFLAHFKLQNNAKC